MRYAVGVESKADGQTVAHVLDLPGCFSRGATPQDALDRLFMAIPAYWDWLRDHGAAAPPADLVAPVTLGVVELVKGSAPRAAQDPGALFAVETEPATPAQVALCLARLAYSRADLTALLAPLPASAWTAAWPDGGTIAGRVSRLAEAERWYVTRLGTLPRLPPTHSPLERLAVVRAAVSARLANLGEEDYATTYIMDGERWTVRKVLRRLLEHECEQVAQLGLLLQGDQSARFPGG